MQPRINSELWNSRDWSLSVGHMAECTPNMAFMFLTLDVSKFSGWLNDSALCRVEREGHTQTVRGARCKPGVGRNTGRQRRKQRAGEGPNAVDGARGTRVKRT